MVLLATSVCQKAHMLWVSWGSLALVYIYGHFWGHGRPLATCSHVSTIEAKKSIFGKRTDGESTGDLLGTYLTV
jgi:hypothetical protein